jgi:hypothetical protein
MRIEGINQPPKVAQTNQGSVVSRSKDPGEGGDVLEISKDAQDVSELAAKVKARADEVSPRLQEIRSKIQEGFYDSRQVRERIAEGMLESGSIKEAVGDLDTARTAKKQLQEADDVRPNKVTQARQRVASEFYDNAAVRSDIADKMLDEAI